MVEGLRLAERAVGFLGAVFALILLGIAAFGGPQMGCPTSSPATGLCAMDWSYQTANAARRVAYALVGLVIVAAGAFIVTRQGAATVETLLPGRAERRLEVAIVALALLGTVLLVAAAAVGFATPPARTLIFTDSELPSVGNFLTAYYGTERAATVYLVAGEVVTATFTAAWYPVGSNTPQYGGGFPPSIEPAGQPYNYSGPFATWYIVPQTGAYTIWIYAELPVYMPPGYTSNVSLTVTAYNVGFPPTVQLTLASLGGVLFAAAVGVDWAIRPRKRAPRSMPETERDERPPRA